MEFKDYYQVLGVDRSASADEIKKAFRRLVRKHHPDINPAPDAAARMQALNEAFEVQRDDEKRAAYDHVGLGAQDGQPFRPPPGWNSGFEFNGASAGPGDDGDHSAFFEALFGATRRRAAQGQARDDVKQARGWRGPDHHARIVVPLQDAFHGATRSITLQRPALDDAGHGVLHERTLQVALPKGIRGGQQIRLTGQGATGLGDGPPGDLYLEVAFEPHAIWRVDGRDLYLTLPVAPLGSGARCRGRAAYARRTREDERADRFADGAQAAPSRSRHSRVRVGRSLRVARTRLATGAG